jgi:hypothetical protein
MSDLVRYGDFRTQVTGNRNPLCPGRSKSRITSAAERVQMSARRMSIVSCTSPRQCIESKSLFSERFSKFSETSSRNSRIRIVGRVEQLPRKALSYAIMRIAEKVEATRIRASVK